MTDLEKIAFIILVSLACPLCTPIAIDIIENKEMEEKDHAN